MAASREDFAVVTRFIRKLRGGSQPFLAEVSDGRSYVVKFTDNLQGPNLPFNESMGAELYKALGLPVAPWKPLFVSDAFLNQNPACWIQTPMGTFRPLSGLCAGSRFLGGDAIRLLEILPGTYFQRVQNRKDLWLAWLIDICAQHSDHRQAIFREDSSGRLDAVFIDHGHMFGGPKGDQHPHFRASRYLDARIFDESAISSLLTLAKLADKLNVDRLWDQGRRLPDEWKVYSAVRNFVGCLDRLSNSRSLQIILETMKGSHRQVSACEHVFSSEERTLPASILRPGIHGTRRMGKTVA